MWFEIGPSLGPCGLGRLMGGQMTFCCYCYSVSEVIQPFLFFFLIKTLSMSKFLFLLFLIIVLDLVFSVKIVAS